MLKKNDILFVDGYNMIGAWPHLSIFMKQDQLALARDTLLFELSNFKKVRTYDEIYVIFDAHLIPGNTQQHAEYGLVVVFTKEGETADAYIEREVAKYISPLNRVIVATSDHAEQRLIFQRGALRLSAEELALEIKYTKQQIAQDINDYYDQMMRRRSPWHLEQLVQLNQLRKKIEDD